MRAGILTDLTRCIGCKGCAYACKEINGLPKHGADTLHSQTWTIVEGKGGVNVRRHCMHCLDPACASVCPVAALRKNPEGPVIYEEARCIGCRYCMLACPFHIPKYEWEKALPKMQKCIFCSENRVSKGRQPACTEVCPAKATVFGEREGLLREARGRIEAHPGRYVDHIYGVEEAGGTSVLYLSGVPFEKLGFPTGLDREPYPRLTWDILSKIPNVVSFGGAMMLGIWWIVNRRMELQRKGDLPGSEAEDHVETDPGHPKPDGSPETRGEERRR